MAPRQVGRTEAILRVEVMQRIAASLGVPASIVGRVGRPADVVIVDDPHAPHGGRDLTRDLLARRHYTGSAPLCHAVVEQDGTVHQTFDEFVTQVAPDQEDADV